MRFLFPFAVSTRSLAGPWKGNAAVQQDFIEGEPDTAAGSMAIRNGRNFDPDRLGLILVFLAVAEHLSFAAAAEVLSQNASTVSRKVSRLEERLNVRLFKRTTRTVALTEAGRLYQRHCAVILDRLQAADSVLSSMNTDEPQGVLRLSLPVAFGHLHLVEPIARFMALYPRVTVEAQFSDRFVDLIGEDFDAAIRIGNLPDASFIARKLASSPRLVVASPAYVAHQILPETPRDLAGHPCMRYSRYKSSGDIWHFQRDDRSEIVNVTINGQFRADSSDAIAKMVAAGVGIGIIPQYICAAGLRSGELVQILPEWEFQPASSIYICYPNSKLVTSKLRVFSKFLVDHFRSPAWFV
jgi:Transcriptional regulator